MLGELIRPEIEELIHQRRFPELRAALADLPHEEIADLFADLPPEHVAVIFRILPRQNATEVFQHLPVETQEATLRALGNEQVAAILNDMAADDRTALLEEMPGEASQRLINLLSPDERKVAVRLLGYPEESIGRRMTPDYVAMRADWTIPHVFSHLRNVGKEKESLNVLYVTDEKGHLIDDIRLRDVVVADPKNKVADIMDGNYVYLRATDDQEEAVQAFKKYDRSVLPVVDSDNILVGIVTVDDVLDVAEQEETEDVQKMAAVEVLDAPYLETGFFTLVRKRGGWLSALFIGEMFTASAMSHYQRVIDSATVLAAFLPLIISSGGNSGSQASTLVIRALALRELTLRDWWRILFRESASGLLLGVWLGLLGLVRIHLWQYMGWADYHSYYHRVAITVAMALVGCVLWGTLVGGMLPVILRLLRLDPATISAPFVATLVDVCGLVIYFTIASLVLHGTLQ
ncbi:MAG TPA: magnesium transporter [Phycisphaerae bacterium]|nr:magnesium transporter [Phycisphaerae bacterium]